MQRIPVSIQTHATHSKPCVRKSIRKQNKKCARNATNARKLRKQKQKYTQAQVTQLTQALALRALRAFEWKSGLRTVHGAHIIAIHDLYSVEEF